MQNSGRCIISSILIFVLVFVNSGCDINFEPDIEQLDIETLPTDQPFTQPITKDDDNQPQEMGDEGVFNSKKAFELCGEILSWGDEQSGYCLAQGGEFYYVWLNRYDVKTFYVGMEELQMRYLESLEKEILEKEELNYDGTVFILEGIGLGLSPALGAAACATVGGCFLYVAGFLVAAEIIVQQGEQIIEDFNDHKITKIQTQYFECRVSGKTDHACREITGAGGMNSGEGDG